MTFSLLYVLCDYLRSSVNEFDKSVNEPDAVRKFYFFFSSCTYNVVVLYIFVVKALFYHHTIHIEVEIHYNIEKSFEIFFFCVDEVLGMRLNKITKEEKKHGKVLLLLMFTEIWYTMTSVQQ